MREALCVREDERLRREAFEAYARSCACIEAGFFAEGRRYAAKAKELSCCIERQNTGDRELLRRIEELFN